MYCKKCGSQLPSHGFICIQCGTLMDSEQIKKQKEYLKENKNNKEVVFLSDKYRNEKIKRDFTKNEPKENKIIGFILIFLILLILIVLAVYKTMGN